MGIQLKHWFAAAVSLLLFSKLLFPAPGKASDLPVEAVGSPPFLCLGYDPERQNWTFVGTAPLRPAEQNCPAGHAFLSVDFPTGPPRPPQKFALLGRCCRLPVGVLTERHVWVAEECPDDAVITGVKATRAIASCEDFGKCMKEWQSIDHLLRCTAVNKSRYRLGERTRAYVIGFNEGLFPRGEHFTTRSRIPIGMRHGVVRSDKFGFDTGGYIGFPWGSLFVARKSKSALYFRRLEFVGAVPDPVAGTPVKVVPDCIAVSDPTDPDAVCVTHEE